jgi:hypothetical protein
MKEIAIQCLTKELLIKVMKEIKYPLYGEITYEYRAEDIMEYFKGEEFCINPKSNNLTAGYDKKVWYVERGYTVISAKEFLKLNKKPERKTRCFWW